MNVETSCAKPNLSIVVAHQEALKKRRKLENDLRVAQHKDHLRLFHKNANISHQVIHFLEVCERIVFEAHASKIPHYRMNATKNIISAKWWLVRSSHHGFPHKYIRKICLRCSMCSAKKTSKSNATEKYHYNKVNRVPTNHLDERLKELFF